MFLKISKSFQNPNYPSQKSPVRRKQINSKKINDIMHGESFSQLLQEMHEWH